MIVPDDVHAVVEHGNYERHDERGGEFATTVAFEQMRRAEFIRYVAQCFPDAECRDEYEACDQRRDDSDVGTRLIRRVHYADEHEADPGDAEQRSNVIEAAPRFVPGYTFRMLGRFVEQVEGG